MHKLLLEDGLLQQRAAYLIDGKLHAIAFREGPVYRSAGAILPGRIEKRISGNGDCLVDLGPHGSAHLSARRGGKDSSLTEGRAVKVQVARAALPGKRAEVTTSLSRAGRYVKLIDRFAGVQESNGAKSMRDLVAPDGFGVSLLPAAALVDDKAVQSEIDSIAHAFAQSEAPAPDPIEAMIARLPAPFEGKIFSDSRAFWASDAQHWQTHFPDLAEAFVLEPDADLFAQYDIDEDLSAIAAGEIALPGGGNLRFAEAHGITLIDVNAGQALTPGARLSLNLAAAQEIAHQLDLQAIGGLIVIDFVDMTAKSDQQKVLKCLDAAKLDRTGWSKFGLVEIKRRKLSPGLGASLRANALSYLGHAVLRQAQKVAQSPSPGAVILVVSPALKAWLTKRDAPAFLYARTARKVDVRQNETLDSHSYSISLST